MVAQVRNHLAETKDARGQQRCRRTPESDGLKDAWAVIFDGLRALRQSASVNVTVEEHVKVIPCQVLQRLESNGQDKAVAVT